jgi:hypothetical protein
LTNAVKHAAARKVTVRLTRRAGGVRLEATDDGRGIAPGAEEAALPPDTSGSPHNVSGLNARGEPRPWAPPHRTVPGPSSNCPRQPRDTPLIRVASGVLAAVEEGEQRLGAAVGEGGLGQPLARVEHGGGQADRGPRSSSGDRAQAVTRPVPERWRRGACVVRGSAVSRGAARRGVPESPWRGPRTAWLRS